MRAPRLPGPTYANVMSTLAVVLALGTGTAYAAGLGPNAVKSRNIATNAVTQRHVADNAVRPPDLATGSVGSRAVQDGAVGADDLAADAVGGSELKASSVDGSIIEDESIGAVDVAPGAISSARMTSGVNRLLKDAGVVAVNKTFPDITVGNGSWPGGAPSSGAQMSASWTQPASTLDVVSGFARVEYPEACSASGGTSRGFDLKIADASGRVISASSPQRTDGTNYNGNGFWAEQADLPGVTFRAPTSVDLAEDPDDFVDYVHFPFELAETVTGGSTAAREVHVFLKRSSSACSPVLTGSRIVVYRYTLPG